MLQILRQNFGYHDVEQQVAIEHDTSRPWLIDARTISLNVNVQLDGEFWHGLNKPYEKLHQCGKQAYDRDRAQDKWFESADLKLVRVTDKEFLAMKKSRCSSSFVRKLGG